MIRAFDGFVFLKESFPEFFLTEGLPQKTQACRVFVAPVAVLEKDVFDGLGDVVNFFFGAAIFCFNSSSVNSFFSIRRSINARSI